MKTYLAENEILLDEKQKKKLMNIVEKLGKDSEYQLGIRFFWGFLFGNAM